MGVSHTHSRGHSQQLTTFTIRLAATAPSLYKEIKQWVLKCDFSKGQCSSLNMLLGSKHVGAILNVLM